MLKEPFNSRQEPKLSSGLPTPAPIHPPARRLIETLVLSEGMLNHQLKGPKKQQLYVTLLNLEPSCL